MSGHTFRGDPYRVLGVDPDASAATIKRRWRDLAREHHPDNAAEDQQAAERLTSRMARINAAYDLLRDPVRRATYDAAAKRPDARSGDAWEHGVRDASWEGGSPFSTAGWDRPSGPPPPPPSRPVTGRFDTTSEFHHRNKTTSRGPRPLEGHAPVSNRTRAGDRESLRASRPNGPVERSMGRERRPPPTLEEARATLLEFGKFRGHTLAEVAAFEPTYIDWIARTITRDHDLVVRARVVQADLDRRGVEREVRPPRPGWGRRTPEGASA